ncbi:hypothetical protein FRC09_007930 [Ceratobasidium sp. 395]|nr:hypothetical protein FRC09_007930 [Ceratobasidium sp. 395]
MGLSERKVKQKIGADPRNLAWAENAAKFGHTYLAKHGWNPTMGLGVAGDGRVSHIAVAQKLDQLGIGAGRPDGPDAIAWKQAKEFEGLLERLNAAGAGEEVEEKVEVVEEMVEEVGLVEGKAGEDVKEDKAKRKERKREEKRKAKAALETPDASTPSASTEESTPVATPIPRRLAHRAKFLAAKRLAGTSTTALSEILGVSSTPASTSSPSTPSGLTPAPAQVPTSLTAIPILDDANQITTSSQSVADYFKAKMRAKASASASISSTPVVVFEEPEVDTPRGGLGSSRRDRKDEDDEGEDNTRPNGLGFSSATGLGFKPASESPSLPPQAPSSPTIEPLPPQDNRESKKDKKRKRKDQQPVAEASTAASPVPADGDPEIDRKAAKRARKEARRAARRQKEAGVDTGVGDRSS